MTFIDQEKAYDIVSRAKLWHAMRRMEEKWIDTVKILYVIRNQEY